MPQGVAGTNWDSVDFTILDAVTQPVLGVGDHSRRNSSRQGATIYVRE